MPSPLSQHADANAHDGSGRYAGADQPARRSFGIETIVCHGRPVPIETRDVVALPFVTLIELSRRDLGELPTVLVVAPLSGHFPFLLRDLVIGLLARHRVLVSDWTNVRHVPLSHGAFGFETNIASVRELMRHAGPDAAVIAVCQGGVSALAAAALLAAEEPATAPRALVLIAAPIDPQRNPTALSQAIRSQLLPWVEHGLMRAVAQPHAGAGRLVYPAQSQLGALGLYLARRMGAGGELTRMVWADDGCDPGRFPFLELYTSIMDLDAAYFIENALNVYIEGALALGTLVVGGRRVEPAAYTGALLTIEGGKDDIAAPGQAGAAHALCGNIADSARASLIVADAGHFSLFYGETWRSAVLPVIEQFLDAV